MSIMSPTELYSARISQATKGTRIVSDASLASTAGENDLSRSRASSEECKDGQSDDRESPRRLALSRLCGGNSPERASHKRVPTPLRLSDSDRVVAGGSTWIVEQSTPSPQQIEIRIEEEPSASGFESGSSASDVAGLDVTEGLLSVSDVSGDVGEGAISPGGESFCCRGQSFDSSYQPSPLLQPSDPSLPSSFSDTFCPDPSSVPVSAQPTLTASPATATLLNPQAAPPQDGPTSFLDFGNTPTIDTFVFRNSYRPVATTTSPPGTAVFAGKVGEEELGPSPRSKRVRSNASSYHTPSKRRARTFPSPDLDDSPLGYTSASSSQLSLLVGTAGAVEEPLATSITNGAHPFAARLTYNTPVPPSSSPFETGKQQHHRPAPSYGSTSTFSSYATASEHPSDHRHASGSWFDVMHDDLWPAPAYSDLPPAPDTESPVERSSGTEHDKDTKGKKGKMARKLVKGVKALRF